MLATPDQIESAIATYEKAARANRQTPALSGNVVVLNGKVADDCMITADLHGNCRNFETILDVADLDGHPRRHLLLQEVCHGGPEYPRNGGCMSHLLLEKVARLKVTYPDRVHFLLSNHELAELTDYPILKANKMLNLRFRRGLQEAYGEQCNRVRDALLEFLRTCPLALRLGAQVLVTHSLPENVDSGGFDVTVFDRPLQPADLEERGAAFQLVWGRDFRAENARQFARLVNAKVLIHGHEPCLGGYQVPNNVQVILDCCGETAHYLLLPAGEELDQASVIGRIQRLL